MIFSSLSAALGYAARNFRGEVLPADDPANYTIGWCDQDDADGMRYISVPVPVMKEICCSHWKNYSGPILNRNAKLTLAKELSTPEGRQRILQHIESCSECIVADIMDS